MHKYSKKRYSKIVFWILLSNFNANLIKSKKSIFLKEDL